MSEFLFWASVASIAYIYVLFPLALAVRARLLPRRVYGDGPPVLLSVVIAARNEAAVIGRKLESVLASGYPRELLEVVVASDGSTDATEDVVAAYADRGVRLVTLPAAGKAAALTAAAMASRGPILVFTDANGELLPGALMAISRPFTDPAVGGVAGNQRYAAEAASNAIAEGERRYWIFETWLKRAEGAGSVVSATGGLYAIRRELFERVPSGVTDDAFLSMGVVAKGKRLVFSSDAVVREPLSATARTEVSRKARVITRGLRTVWERRELLNPLKHGFYAVELWTHKVLRRLIGIPHLLLLATSIVLWSEGTLYRLAAIAQLTFYGLGVAGLLLRRTRAGRKLPLSFPAYFLAVNAAASIGLANFIRGRTIERWEPVRATDDAPEPRVLRRPIASAVVVLCAAVIGAAAGITPGIVAVLAVGCVVVAVLLLVPDLATLAAIALLYSNVAILAVRQHGVPPAAGLVPALLFGAPLAYHLFIKREPLIVGSALPFLGAFAIIQAVSGIQAADPGRAISSLGQFLVEGIALYVLITNVVRTQRMLVRVVGMLLVLGALLSALMLVKAVTGSYDNDFGGLAQVSTVDRRPTDVLDLERGDQVGGFQRQSGPISGANRFAQYLLPLVPLAAALVRRARSKVGTAVFLSSGGLVLCGLVLTFSRGAFLALALSAAVLVAVRVLRPAHLAAAGAVFLVFIVLAPAYRERILSIEGVSAVFSDDEGGTDSSVEGRFTENAAALAVTVDHPLLGVGPGNFPLYYREYANVAPANVRSGERAAHNLYLGVAAETGVFGLIAVMGVFAVTLRDLIRARRGLSNTGRMLASSFFVAVVGLMATGVFLHFAFIRYFWLFMALATVAARVARLSDDAVVSAVDRRSHLTEAR